MVWYGIVDPEGSEHEVQETLGFQSLLVGQSFRGPSSLYAHTMFRNTAPAAGISIGKPISEWRLMAYCSNFFSHLFMATISWPNRPSHLWV